MKVKDLKKILDVIPDEVDIVIENEDGQVYDCYAEEKWYMVGDEVPCLAILKE